jgi:hypothetical protein
MTNDALAGSAEPRRWRALTVSLGGAFMVLLDVSIVNVALPYIEREFGVSAGTVGGIRIRPDLRPGSGAGRPAGSATRSAGAACS